MYGMDIILERPKSSMEESMKSLPSYYPTPAADSQLLFYLQRNHNINTILYEVNLLPCGSINPHEPMKVFWKRYDDAGERIPISYIQDKLVFGYKSKIINNHTFQFQLVANDSQTFYIARKTDNYYCCTTKINEEMCILSNIYAFAENQGAFPSIKNVEFYGTKLNNGASVYQSIQF